MYIIKQNKNTNFGFWLMNLIQYKKYLAVSNCCSRYLSTLIAYSFSVRPLTYQ